MSINSRVAQVFNVGGLFTPSKASAYLLTKITHDEDPFFNLDTISSSGTIVMDSSNFSNIKEGNIIRKPVIRFDASSTGGGSVVYSSLRDKTDYPIINYPIKIDTATPFTSYLHYRVKNITTTTKEVRIQFLLDGSEISEITGINLSPSVQSDQFATTINISDNKLHTLGMRVFTRGVMVDKIFLSKTMSVTDGSISQSPFVTLHSALHKTSSKVPLEDNLGNCDFKSSVKDLRNNGYYNFDLTFPDVSDQIEFVDDYYAWAIWGAGTSSKNNITWKKTAPQNENNVIALYN